MAVYFARAEGTGLVKIGYAVRVASRIKALQAGCPYQLTVVRVVDPGNLCTESDFHTLFAEHHRERDWFNWSPRMATEPAPPLRVPATGSFSALIDQLGGPPVVAARTSLEVGTVRTMRARNMIAARHWVAISKLGVPIADLMACLLAKRETETKIDRRRRPNSPPLLRAEA